MNKWFNSKHWNSGNLLPRIGPLLSPTMRDQKQIAVGIEADIAGVVSACVIGRDAPTAEWICQFHVWATQEILDRNPSLGTAIHFSNGDGTVITKCTFLDGIISASMLAADLASNRKVAGIGIDPFCPLLLHERLRSFSVPPALILPVGRNPSYRAVADDVRIRLEHGILRHCASEVMDWFLDRSVIDDRGNLCIQSSSIGAVPLLALFNAAAMFRPAALSGDQAAA